MPTNTGNLDISQVNVAELSGGADSAQLVTTTLSPKTPGDLAIWDTSGNLVDAGAGTGVGIVTEVTATAPLTSSGSINPDIALTIPLAVGYGGSGTATPGLVAGPNIVISGSWPDQTVGFTGTIPESSVSSLVSDLAGKAPLNSPALTGTPTAPTPSTSDNSTEIATTAYVKAQILSGVTSVALTVPGFLSVSGSPITSTGTLAVSLATESANAVMAGPTTGSPATPTFRALVAADIPAIPESGVTGLVSDLAAKGTVSSVALTVPSDLTVTGSPITGSGTLAVTRNTQAANTVLAGPTTGAPAAPFFRTLVAADIGATVPIAVNFSIGNGAIGSNLAYTFATRPGTVGKCKVLVIASDPVLSITFRIRMNGVDVFSVDPTLGAGATVGTLSTFTALTSPTLAVVQDDIFIFDITAGASTWSLSVTLES